MHLLCRAFERDNVSVPKSVSYPKGSINNNNTTNSNNTINNNNEITWHLKELAQLEH